MYVHGMIIMLYLAMQYYILKHAFYTEKEELQANTSCTS
jgi:hypothetical protein